MEAKYDYLIVGAGLFGSVCARELTDMGKKCLVIDRRRHIAGNIYTEKIEDIDVHVYGGHIFHTSNESVWNYVNKYAKFKNFVNSPMANYKGALYNLPFNMNTFHQMWGVNTPLEAQRIIEQQKKEIEHEPQNLEEQAISLVGRDIYEKLIKGYTEKQWAHDCKDLPAFIIKRIPVRFTYDNNYFNDSYQGIPENGYTELVKNILSGIEVVLDANYFSDKEKYDGMASKIIFTGAIDEFYEYCYGALEWRSLEFKTEVLDVENYQGVAAVNYTDRETPYTRILEHKHFSSAKSKKTVITKEYPKTWEFGDEPYYPVNDEKNSEKYTQYRLLAKREKKVLFGGRLGSYKYYDMDKDIEAALELVRSL